MRTLFDRVGDRPPDVPLIHFGVGTGELLALMASAGGDVIGVDWMTPFDAAWDRVGGPAARAVQGNLDPAVLLAPWEAVERETLAVLAAAAGRDGHIFNLGHGVLARQRRPRPFGDWWTSCTSRSSVRRPGRSPGERPPRSACS